MLEKIREEYGLKQRAASIGRRQAWSERSQQTLDRDRQRVASLKRAVRPKEPASHEDPWEIADAALQQLTKVRSVRMRPEQVARIDDVAEAIRRLAWGPSDDEPTGTKTGTNSTLTDRLSDEPAGRSVGRAGLEPATGGL